MARSVLLTLALVSLMAGEEPWPKPVLGHRPVDPGEHPRLFFRRADLPRIRARAATPQGQALIRRLKAQLGGGEALPEIRNDMTSGYGKVGPKPRASDWPLGTYSISHVAGFGMLWQITGEKKYADLARGCMELAFAGVRDRDGRYSWKKPDGALRAGPSLGWYAVGYDLCYDGWDEDFRQKVGLAIQDYDEGQHRSLDDLVRGRRHMPASNHWGMQIGGGALAVLAIMHDPFIDMDRIGPLLEASQEAMKRNVTEGFGDHGWYPEGDGTGSMASHIVYTSALQAWRIAGGQDFWTPRPNAQWTTLRWILQTKHRDGQPLWHARGAYPHNVWNRTSLSGGGLFSQGFGVVTPEQAPALMWLYNRVGRAADIAAEAPFDTISPYPHRTVLSLINWPFDLPERNPAASLPRAVLDHTHGFLLARNRFQDEHDLVVTCQTRTTRGWHESGDGGRVVIQSGAGKPEVFGYLPSERDVLRFVAAADGSCVATTDTGGCLAIDFSGVSGWDAVLALTGPGAEGGDVRFDLGPASVHLRLLGSGPQPTLVGDAIAIGDQRLSLADGHLVWAVFGEPWVGPEPVEPHVPVVVDEPAAAGLDASSAEARLLELLQAHVPSAIQPRLFIPHFKGEVDVRRVDGQGRLIIDADGAMAAWPLSRLDEVDRLALARELVAAGILDAAPVRDFYITR